ncbi:MAG: restriction endonuclease subunit S [Varibaculum timonense]
MTSSLFVQCCNGNFVPSAKGILVIEAATNQAIAAARPSDRTSKEYLFYYLIENKNQFIELGKGGAQPNISQTVIKAFPYRMPPLLEQKEIARILDEQLAWIEAADSKVQ